MEALEERQRERRNALQREAERRAAVRIPQELVQRLQTATRHCAGNGDWKQFRAPPHEAYFKDHVGQFPCEEINLAEWTIGNDWLSTIATAIAALGKTKLGMCKRLVLSSATNVNDASFYGMHKLKCLVSIDISKCYTLTDESLHTIRRHCSLLQALCIHECRHFTSDALIQTWKDCTRLRSLGASGVPGMTDKVLQCIATTKRIMPSFGNATSTLHLRHCKHVTSSGISYLATSNLKELQFDTLELGQSTEISNMAFFGFETSPAFATLVTLNLQALHVNETAISWIAKGCRALRRLDLSYCNEINDFCLLLLSPLVLEQLTDLQLKECKQLTDRGLQNLMAAAVDKLEMLKANGVLEDQDDQEEAVVTKLRILNVKNCVQISDVGIEAVVQFSRQLVQLNLRGLRRISDHGMVQIAKCCPQLQQLKCSGRHISTQTFKVLGRLCHHLQVIDASERNDEALDYVVCIKELTLAVSKSTSQLRKLNLQATSVNDAAITVVAMQCPLLECINLSKCPRITDVAIQALATACFRLEILLLASTRSITDKALMAMAFTQLPLMTLDLCGNTNITDHGLQTLCAACPTLRELRLKHCERLSIPVVQHCNRTWLPWTKQYIVSKQLTGSTATLGLASLPSRQITLLQHMLREYEAAVVLQTTMRKWRRKMAAALWFQRRRWRRETRAARKIQRCVRQFLRWRRYVRFLSQPDQQWKVVMLQAHIRGRRSRWQTRILQFTLHRAARVIQRAYRPHYAVRMAIRNAYAIKIQARYKAYKARQQYVLLMQAHKRQLGLKIWKWYRRCRHRREMTARSQWLMLKIRHIQMQWRVYVYKRDLRTYIRYHRRRIIKIQSVWRMAIARKMVADQRAQWNQAATIIQRVYRCFRLRLQVIRYQLLVSTSATILQTYWRMYRHRQRYLLLRQCIIQTQRRLRYKKAVDRLRRMVYAALLQHHTSAAVVIQRVYRGHLGRRRAILFRKIRNAKYAIKGQNAMHAMLRRRFIRLGAVLRIQHWIQRILVRRKMLRVKKWREYVAARCIQRYICQFTAKLRIEQKKERQMHASTNVQRMYRGFHARQRVKALKHAQQCLRSALVIQRVYRGYRGRRVAAERRRTLTNAAQIVQRAFRSRQARIFYEIAQATASLKEKERYDNSFLGKWDAARGNPMQELFHKAKLLREKQVLSDLKAKWDANRIAQERATRKLRREVKTTWEATDEVIAQYFNTQRKLYGVSENVYQSHKELQERTKTNAALKAELVGLYQRMHKFKHALQSEVETRRMLDGQEVLALLKSYGLYRENYQSNQDEED